MKILEKGETDIGIGRISVKRNMEYAIVTKKLTKKYHRFLANDHIDLVVEKGAICGLIGRNGAGKTTLMRQLLGLCESDEGEIELLGTSLEDARCQIGSLIETPTFYEHMTLYENLKIRALLIGLAHPHQAIETVLKEVDLLSKKEHKVKSLSLGMRQKLGIANAMLGEPKLLILDEPINGLDPIAIREVRDILLSINRKGTTILLSSHILGEMEKMATDYAFIVDGKLVKQLNEQSIREQHIDLEEYFMELAGGEHHA